IRSPLLYPAELQAHISEAQSINRFAVFCQAENMFKYLYCLLSLREKKLNACRKVSLSKGETN
ncbi:MAG TPA: hypothetical protein VJZ16_01585, partial [Syntrophales bacterium]|nr:hypothetical protein [Syntrophales bacterium]